MHFFALRIVCDNCGDPFIKGGSQKSDLARWQGLIVDCPACGAVIQATTGEVIDLSPPRVDPPEAEPLPPLPPDVREALLGDAGGATRTPQPATEH